MIDEFNPDSNDTGTRTVVDKTDPDGSGGRGRPVWGNDIDDGEGHTRGQVSETVDGSRGEERER